MAFTPGIKFLSKALLPVALPGTIILYIRSVQLIDVSTWHLVALFLGSLPAYVVFSVIKRDIRDARQARMVGARLAPYLKGKLPGNVDVLRRMMRTQRFGYPDDHFKDILETHGPTFNFRILWENTIFTIDPHIIKTILATDFNNYVKGQRFHESVEPVLGTGVFNSDGDMWKFHRSMTRPFFSRDRITHFDIFDKHCDDAIDLMRMRMRAGYAVNFQDLIGRFTLDSATSFLFGSCVHSLSAGLPYPHNVTPPGYGSQRHPADDFAEAFLTAQSVVCTRERFSWLWPLSEIFTDKTIAPMKIVNAYIEPIVEDALAKKVERDMMRRQLNEPMEKDKEEVGDEDTVLDHLVNWTTDQKVLKDETLNILLAGRDTTAATLTFIIYFLAMYPHVLSTLREEILTKVGPHRRPTFDDIRDMKYLRAVINETLRLYPVVPFNVRDSVDATTWPSPDPTKKPMYIPPHTKIAYSVFIMHRQIDLWGPDAHEFDPDRFLDARLKKYLTPNPFIFLPFNAGPRICLGQQFAYNEMSFFLIRLLQKFSFINLDLSSQSPDTLPPAEWKNEPTGRKKIEKFWPKNNLTMYANGGLWVKMTEVGSTE